MQKEMTMWLQSPKSKLLFRSKEFFRSFVQETGKHSSVAGVGSYCEHMGYNTIPIWRQRVDGLGSWKASIERFLQSKPLGIIGRLGSGETLIPKQPRQPRE